MKFNSSRALSATATMPSRERDAKNQLFIAPGTNNATASPPLPSSPSAQVFRGAPMIPTRRSSWKKISSNLSLYLSLSLSLSFFLSLSVSLSVISYYTYTIFLYSHVVEEKKRGGSLLLPFFWKKGRRIYVRWDRNESKRSFNNGRINF